MAQVLHSLCIVVQIIQTVRGNNHQFVTLCETVKAVEPSLARVHNVLNNSRSLLAALRQYSSTESVALQSVELPDATGRSNTSVAPVSMPYYDMPTHSTSEASGTEAWLRDLQQVCP